MNRQRIQRAAWGRIWLAARYRRMGDWAGAARVLMRAGEWRLKLLLSW